jgi:hypothetical protein
VGLPASCVHTVRMSSPSLTIRQARPGDAAARMLAELDSAAPLTGPVLVAESEGRPVAAVSVEDGRAAADPFLQTADAVAVLRMRATQLQPGIGAGAIRRRLAGWRASRRPAMRAA